LGRSAPVAMEVAIAFAVSWKPFVKSNMSAVKNDRDDDDRHVWRPSRSSTGGTLVCHGRAGSAANVKAAQANVGVNAATTDHGRYSGQIASAEGFAERPRFSRFCDSAARGRARASGLSGTGPGGRQMFGWPCWPEQLLSCAVGATALQAAPVMGSGDAMTSVERAVSQFRRTPSAVGHSERTRHELREALRKVDLLERRARTGRCASWTTFRNASRSSWRVRSECPTADGVRPKLTNTPAQPRS